MDAHCTMMHVSLWAHGHSNSRSRLLLAHKSMPWLIYAWYQYQLQLGMSLWTPTSIQGNWTEDFFILSIFTSKPS